MMRAPKLVTSSESARLHEGAVRLAVVADTHSEPHPRSTELLRAAAPNAILHAGDIGAPIVLDRLREIAPVLAVRGNIDGRDNQLPDDLAIDLLAAAAEPVLRIFLTHIAVYGAKLRADVAKRATAARAQLVVCGHSHVPFIGRDRNLTGLQPGLDRPAPFSPADRVRPFRAPRRQGNDAPRVVRNGRALGAVSDGFDAHARPASSPLEPCVARRSLSLRPFPPIDRLSKRVSGGSGSKGAGAELVTATSQGLRPVRPWS